MAQAAHARHDYASELTLLRPLAEQGNAAAQGLLGLMYYEGLGITQNYVEAARWLRKVAEQGDAKVQAFLGNMYHDGIGVPRDYVQAYMWLNLAAAGGDKEAVQDRERLEHLMTAEQIAEAQRRTAAWQPVRFGKQQPAAPVAAGQFENGWAAYKRADYATAVRLWRSLAERGNPIAQLLLGSMSADGRGVKRDYAEATKWYRKAKGQGPADALCVLARRCDAFPDYTKTTKWLRNAGDKGDALAQFVLGFMYDNGIAVKRNDAEAANWNRKAAEQGDAKAQASLGVFYEFGKGVRQDYAEATKWYRKAADQGNADGQSYLAGTYDSGHGVPQDYDEAAKWYRKAAEQGVADAQSSLGVIYYSGEGAPQDFVEAYKWLSLAAERLPTSEVWEKAIRDRVIENRDRVAAKMTPPQIAEAQRLVREWKPK